MRIMQNSMKIICFVACGEEECAWNVHKELFLIIMGYAGKLLIFVGHGIDSMGLVLPATKDIS